MKILKPIVNNVTINLANMKHHPSDLRQDEIIIQNKVVCPFVRLVRGSFFRLYGG